jgi:hypothetical protein
LASRKDAKLVASSQQKPGRGKAERTSTLASSQKTVVARNSDSRKGGEKIITAKADTVRLKGRR